MTVPPGSAEIEAVLQLLRDNLRYAESRAVADAALALNLNDAPARRQYAQALVMFTEAMDILARFPDQRTESYLLWSLGSIRRDLGSFHQMGSTGSGPTSLVATCLAE